MLNPRMKWLSVFALAVFLIGSALSALVAPAHAAAMQKHAPLLKHGIHVNVLPAGVPSECSNLDELDGSGSPVSYTYPYAPRGVMVTLTGHIYEYAVPVANGFPGDSPCGWFTATVSATETGSDPGDARIYLTSGSESGCNTSNGYLASTHVYNNGNSTTTSGYTNTVYSWSSSVGYGVNASLQFIPHSGANGCPGSNFFQISSAFGQP